ncbi:MAG: hypothetical protein IJ099_04480 [Alphaproteobacteria bacterium]|nr:hypothetical protein [Alphaproteobacteria bacterium]
MPEDLATQSTLRNWKSCMHTTGCNHQFVDDSICLGSIVAYGYDSQNPQKSVSRLLIHPYYDENGNVAYKVNDRIYGKDNTGFRKAVEKATEHFNEGKVGSFELANGLYNDNGNIRNLYLLPRDAEGKYILDDMAKDGKIILGNEFVFIPSGAKLRASDKIEVIFNNRIPDGIDLREVENLKIEGNVAFGNNVKLPDSVQLKDAVISG